MTTDQSRELEQSASKLCDLSRKLAALAAKKLGVDDKELVILFSLLQDGNTSNAELAKRLRLNDGDAAA
jgi:hypothetical protein